MGEGRERRNQRLRTLSFHKPLSEREREREIKPSKIKEFFLRETCQLFFFFIRDYKESGFGAISI